MIDSPDDSYGLNDRIMSQAFPRRGFLHLRRRRLRHTLVRVERPREPGPKVRLRPTRRADWRELSRLHTGALGELRRSRFRGVDLGRTLETPTKSYDFYLYRGFTAAVWPLARTPGSWIREEPLREQGFEFRH